MTVQRDTMRSLAEHWALVPIGESRIRRAHAHATRLYVASNLGSQLVPLDREEHTDTNLVEHVAFAYEVAASEGIEELLKPRNARAQPLADIAEAAAYQSFELARSLPFNRESLEESVRHILQLGALAYCADRWAEFRGWLRDRDVTPDLFHASDTWDSRVLRDIGEIWVRLLRKQGWEDLTAVAETVARMRIDQEENEARLFALQQDPAVRHATAWRLVALYHWAKLSEIVATYLMQGEPTDIATDLDFHFDRAIAAATAAADPAFAVVLRWQRVMVHRMVAGSLWSVARFGPEIREVVSTVTRSRSMYEMLPPQRIAIQEQGLMDPASAAVVVDLPTSAGKTILAEFKIVQALNQFQQAKGWVAYVVPTRALVGQITRRLRSDLGSSGLRIEELTAAVEIDDIEASLLTSEDAGFDVLVATPEKLSLVVRSGVIDRPLALAILDEAHNIEDADRGVRIELLLATIKRDCRDANFLLMMPHVPNGNDLARWLAPQTGRSISLATSPWQPNDRLIGLVSIEAPDNGDARAWSLRFEPLVTSASSLRVTGRYRVGEGAQLSVPHSRIKANLGMIAGAAARVLSDRGTSIVICSTIPSVWSVARELAVRLPESQDDDISFVQRFLRTEVSEEFDLVELLGRRIGVHHAGLSDETRALMEWLAESGKLRILVATTGLSQGLNFPVSSILLASRHLQGKDSSREMTPREFWNLAGRAGRVDQDSIGVVGLSCKDGEREKLISFVSAQTGKLVSRITTLLEELDDAGRLLDLERSIYGDQWADFRSYVAHLFAQKRSLDAVLADTELLLRSTFGYSAMSESTPKDRERGARLLEATRAYASELAGRVETATLADSTGFTPEGIRAAMRGMREFDRPLGIAEWEPGSLFGDVASSALPNLMRVMLQLPQIRNSIEELNGTGPGLGDRAAKVAADWVSGISVKEIAARYFAEGEKGVTASLTAATRAIYRNLTTAATWGLSALSKLPTSGIDFGSLSADELRRINLLGAMLYHGVDTEAGVVMRMSHVPRSVARSVGDEFVRLEPGAALRPDRAREFLREMAAGDWERHVPSGSSMDGGDYLRLWRLLSGEAGQRQGSRVEA